MRSIRSVTACTVLGVTAFGAACPATAPEPAAAPDTSAPDTLLMSAPAALVASRQAIFEFTATELGARFECSLEAGAFEACTSPQYYLGLDTGGHAFRVRAIDAAGNTDPSPAWHYWTIDAMAPETSICRGPPDPDLSATAIFELACSEADCRFECALDGAAPAPCLATAVYPGLAAGTHLLQARAIDAAGNRDPSAAVWTWAIDLTPPPAPSLQLNGGAPRTLTRTIDVAIDAVDAVAVQISESADFDGASWQPLPAHVDFSLADRAGDHLLFARVRDAAGNPSTSAAAAIALDRAPGLMPFVTVPQADTVEPDQDGGEHAVDRAIVGLRRLAEAQTLAEALRVELASWVTGALPGQRALLVRVPPDRSVDEALVWLRGRPEVEWAETDRAAPAALPAGAPDDSGVQSGSQWYLQQIRALAAWELLDRIGIAFGAPATRVAVIDTGIDLTHRDLAGHLDSGLDRPLPANLVDADDGVSFSPWRAPQDEDGHGTQVAGIIGAIADNEAVAAGGIAGIAGAVTLLPIKAGRGQLFFAFAIAAALQRASDEQADVVNLSFELPDSVLLRRAVRAAAQREDGPGVLLVHAAGNWGPAPGCPPAVDAAAPADLYPELFSVAAVDRDGQRAVFSRFGSGIDLAAPGGSSTACGAAPDDDDMLSTTTNSTYARWYGTSAAAAVVSGVAALLLSIDRAADGVRDLDVRQLEHALITGAALAGDADLSAAGSGNRRVDAWTAARYVSCLQVVPFHDGGDGSCLPPGICAFGFHLGGSVHCVPLGVCSLGFHDGGDGTCVKRDRCAAGYYLIGDRCVTVAADGGIGSDAVADCGPDSGAAADANGGGDAAATADAGSDVEDGGVSDGGMHLRVWTLQPGPETAKDIWTTSTYSYVDDGNSAPGGGRDDDYIDLGGWDDRYVGLLQFDLTALPPDAVSAHIELYCSEPRGDGTTEIILQRITEFWDWRLQGTGRDRLRLWWADRPAVETWSGIPLSAPTVGAWYGIDITDLYNGWQSGALPNYGVALWPVRNDNRWDRFYSSQQVVDPALRPRLVVVAAAR
ncbi:MAG: S8 family serine peptidase [Deltaproteobacteria bacterium]|nr:S8 family serine peptidase [Deltaproteobacteria bacterium]